MIDNINMKLLLLSFFPIFFLKTSSACFGSTSTNRLAIDDPSIQLERFIPELNGHVRPISPQDNIPFDPVNAFLNPRIPQISNPNPRPNDLDPFDFDPLFPFLPPTPKIFGADRTLTTPTRRPRISRTSRKPFVRETLRPRLPPRTTVEKPVIRRPPAPIPRATFSPRVTEAFGFELTTPRPAPSPPDFPRPGPLPQDALQPVFPNTGSPEAFPRDCADIQSYRSDSQTGFHTVYRPSCLNPQRCAIQVLCDLDMDGGGWTVIQQRSDASISFFQNWQTYRQGFGDSKNFWIGNIFNAAVSLTVCGERTSTIKCGNKIMDFPGNEYLHELSNVGSAHEIVLLIQLTDTNDRTSFAMYDSFHVASESQNYRLNLGNLQGTHAVDNMASSRNSSFSTHDVETDKEPGERCGDIWKSGWWHAPHCAFTGNINVPFDRPGIQWNTDRGSTKMKSVSMKIRPKRFEPLVVAPGDVIFDEDEPTNSIDF